MSSITTSETIRDLMVTDMKSSYCQFYCEGTRFALNCLEKLSNVAAPALTLRHLRCSGPEYTFNHTTPSRLRLVIASSGETYEYTQDQSVEVARRARLFSSDRNHCTHARIALRWAGCDERGWSAGACRRHARPDHTCDEQYRQSSKDGGLRLAERRAAQLLHDGCAAVLRCLRYRDRPPQASRLPTG